MKHTPGRLESKAHTYGIADTGDYDSIFEILGGGKVIAWFGGDETDEANARRMTACWNACDGIPTEDLEECTPGGLFYLADHANDLAIQRDELLQALKQMLDAFYHDPLGGGQDAAVEAALDAVAKAEGEK